MTKPLLVVLFLSVAWATGQAQVKCSLRKDADSIKVYTCHTDTSKFKSIRAEFTVHTTLEKLRAVMLDFPGYTRWQFNTTESAALARVATDEYIYYAKISAPWPVSNRDMVVRLRLTQSADQLIIRANSVADIKPVLKNYVRVPVSHSQWLVTRLTNQTLQVHYQLQIDPGGNVPSWLVNWVCAQGPYESFRNLKRLLEKGGD